MDLSQIGMLGKGDLGARRGCNMTSASVVASPVSGGWRKLAALILGVAAVGLPVNHLAAYALLMVATVVIFSGEVRADWRAWFAALVIVAVAIAGQILLAP